MEFGSIVLANSKKGFIPQAIKWFTGSQFSHSLVLYEPFNNRPMGIEAAGIGVSVLPFDKNYIQDANQGYEVWEFKADPLDKIKGMSFIIDELESSYGSFEYAWFIWRKLNSILGRNIQNQNNWVTKGTICSQLCVQYITQAGYGHIFKDYGSGAVAPEDLRNVMIQNPALFQLTTTKI